MRLGCLSWHLMFSFNRETFTRNFDVNIVFFYLQFLINNSSMQFFLLNIKIIDGYSYKVKNKICCTLNRKANNLELELCQAKDGLGAEV